MLCLFYTLLLNLLHKTTGAIFFLLHTLRVLHCQTILVIIATHSSKVVFQVFQHSTNPTVHSTKVYGSASVRVRVRVRVNVRVRVRVKTCTRTFTASLIMITGVKMVATANLTVTVSLYRWQVIRGQRSGSRKGCKSRGKRSNSDNSQVPNDDANPNA